MLVLTPYALTKSKWIIIKYINNYPQRVKVSGNTDGRKKRTTNIKKEVNISFNQRKVSLYKSDPLCKSFFEHVWHLSIIYNKKIKQQNPNLTLLS